MDEEKKPWDPPEPATRVVDADAAPDAEKSPEPEPGPPAPAEDKPAPEWNGVTPCKQSGDQ